MRAEPPNALPFGLGSKMILERFVESTGVGANVQSRFEPAYGRKLRILAVNYLWEASLPSTINIAQVDLIPDLNNLTRKFSANSLDGGLRGLDQIQCSASIGQPASSSFQLFAAIQTLCFALPDVTFTYPFTLRCSLFTDGTGLASQLTAIYEDSPQ